MTDEQPFEISKPRLFERLSVRSIALGLGAGWAMLTAYIILISTIALKPFFDTPAEPDFLDNFLFSIVLFGTAAIAAYPVLLLSFLLIFEFAIRVAPGIEIKGKRKRISASAGLGLLLISVLAAILGSAEAKDWHIILAAMIAGAMGGLSYHVSLQTSDNL
ncbi:hypothetical protein [Roseibium polysiphoniae]|uniref:hypothetical protein n=1 Tax=Roseibium polysiphoniae TaxID=2571221 RepID=UPI003297AF83